MPRVHPSDGHSISPILMLHLLEDFYYHHFGGFCLAISLQVVWCGPPVLDVIRLG